MGKKRIRITFCRLCGKQNEQGKGKGRFCSIKCRFLSKVEKTSSCWIWKGGSTNKRYGTFQKGPQSLLAHRVSYELFNGEIPTNKCVCHECDNGFCVNPEHLWLGTHQENMDDMKNKGRDNHSNPYRKISIEMHEKIKLLRSYGLTKTKIAEKFNCTRTNIARILTEAPNLPKKGSAHPIARLKEKEVKEIFELDNLGMKRKDIAKKYSVAPSTITKILKRDAWKHVHTKENAS